MEIVEGNLSHSCVDVKLFDFDSWVEENIFELLENIEGDLSHYSVTIHSFDFDSWVEEVIFFYYWVLFEEDLSHSSDKKQSFDFGCWVEEEFFELLPSDEVYSIYFDLWV